ncbi:MAG: hypothetical protein HZA89_04340 [Verrucomicrobia bacterium]|nr:hypothetical protein [Verrucomicrobiota bacterium]
MTKHEARRFEKPEGSCFGHGLNTDEAWIFSCFTRGFTLPVRQRGRNNAWRIQQLRVGITAFPEANDCP